uniref:Uncharacterized protein n=1 Tax=viral metagenome TaxID=1070528 RepID=A0A6C0CM18_9ZZZZ
MRFLTKVCKVPGCNFPIFGKGCLYELAEKGQYWVLNDARKAMERNSETNSSDTIRDLCLCSLETNPNK